MRRKRAVCLFLIAGMMFSQCGCNEQTVETSSKVIELVEPVNAATDAEQADYRDLFDVDIYAATVFPTIREYSFAAATEVERFDVFLGETVKKGQGMVYGSTDALDEQIEAMEEKLADMETSIAEEEAELAENLQDPKGDAERLEGIVEYYESIKPAEYVYESTLKAEDDADTTVSGGDSETEPPGEDKLVKNPAYEAWEKEARVFEGRYRIQSHNIHMQEEAFRQKKELYELEHAYYLEQLEDLKSKRSKNILSAKSEGEIVAIADNDYGNYQAAAEESIIAVGDMENKVLKCDFISKADVAAAQEIYALIDGVRYEVEYQPVDNDEYAKITATGAKVYSTFLLQGDAPQVEVGDFAIIALVKERREQVLSVPKTALHKDETGSFVYVVQDGESVAVSVKTGMSDGVYTEILSGLTEEDAILVDTALEYSEETVTVKKGSFQSSFEGRGAMYYPVTEGVYNPVEYGTVYFGEYLVNQYERVEKGDVIATVRVATDDLTIQRNEIKLQRAMERLEDLREAGEEENEAAIEARLEQIADIQELLEQMRQDGQVKEIRAGRSGIVVDLAELEKETILYKEQHIAQIADAGTCYVVVEDTNHLLHYGNQVTITYTNNENQEKTSSGVVANVSAAGVSQDLQLDYAFILLPEDSIADMALSNTNGDNWWNRFRYNVTADIRQMDNVLVVPKKAVKEISGCTYVYVKDEQGNVKACSFVAGGYDASNYWVIEGLSEGMELCLK
ncbi:MAG: hypothetical protein IJ379_00345 [Lachnospiraceae bacterium]|nr:hypothetical protein [Lachnospiraceae bacterium]